MYSHTSTTNVPADKTYEHAVTERELPSLPQDGSKRSHSWIRRVCVTLWIWEMLSILTSTTCIAAVVVLLSLYDGKPLPSWRYGLTINGVISILAVITKASMVLPIAEAISQLKWDHFWRSPRPVRDFESFDSASRGPWGSLTMLLNVRLWSLGALGAALTVAAMFVEPALQQIPAFPTRVVKIGDAVLNRSLNFTDRPPTLGSAGVTLSNGLKSAMYLGIFGAEEAVTHTPACSSGNCTWPTFDSLAVCSACADLSDLLLVSPGTDETAWMVTNTSEGYNSKPALSRHRWLYAPDIDDAAQIAYRAMGNHTILDFQSVYWPPESASDDPPSGVFECVLYFCVKTFSAATTDGHFTETVLSFWPPANTSMPEQPDIDFWRDYGNNETFHLGVAEQKKNFTLSPPDAEATYTVDRLTFDLMQHWAQNYLFITAIYSSSGDEQPARWEIDDIAGKMYIELTEQLGPNKTIQGYSVPSTAGPGRLMAQIATGLTTYMRQSEIGSLVVNGDTIFVESYVQARWYWLACPLSLLLLTLAFMLSTIFTSARRGVPTWKSSSLAVLIHGLNDVGSRAMTDSRLDKLEENASDYRMAVQQQHGLWSLEARRN
ncbi:polynucleotide adenylyltransferase [Elasticomyces elasticus]|nr:polynucleotide adenylyltransferase [Elasticomyces elasticus]